MRTIIVLVGLLLVAASAAWFFTELPSNLHEALVARGILAAGTRAAGPTGSWEMIKTGLDVANALIGCFGIYLAVRGPRRSDSA